MNYNLKRALWMTMISIAMLAIVGATLAVYLFTGNHVGTGKRSHLGLTPTQIQSIEAIGEWEFLAIRDEEIVDTLRAGFFSDDELVRIYYGTLRIGIDTREAGKNWIKSKGDSIVVTLPPVKLLDENFIDEALTRSFFESGTWDDQSREALYQRAAAQMKARCLTSENMASARRNASQQMRNLMRAMGFDNVSVRFEEKTL